MVIFSVLKNIIVNILICHRASYNGNETQTTHQNDSVQLVADQTPLTH